MNKGSPANLGKRTFFTRVTLVRLLVFAFSLNVIPALTLAQQTPSNPPPQAQKTFATAHAAAEAFIQATESWDVVALQQVLGAQGEDLIASEDPVRDKNFADAFTAKARQKTSVTVDPKNSNRAILQIGNDDWPMPIPIVKRNGAWLFDTKAGRQEILNRRMRANELDAIAICRGYVDAREEHSQTKHDGAEVNQDAQGISSTPAKHDGLVWRNVDGSLGGPIAEQIADTLQEGYANRPSPACQRY